MPHAPKGIEIEGEEMDLNEPEKPADGGTAAATGTRAKPTGIASRGKLLIGAVAGGNRGLRSLCGQPVLDQARSKTQAMAAETIPTAPPISLTDIQGKAGLGRLQGQSGGAGFLGNVVRTLPD